MTNLVRNISEIGAQFAIDGTFVEGEEVESGHINTTYLASYQDAEGEISRYILQRINENVFPQPLVVMRNIERVTNHINRKVFRKKRDFGGQTLSLYPGRDGKNCVSGSAGGVWRCYNFIEGCRTYDVVENTRQAYQAAKAFGAFQDLVSDLSVDVVDVTIPGFHDTPARYAKLMEVIKKDSCDRVKDVAEEIDFITSRESITGVLLEHLKAGRLTERVTHNDTKLNNVMIDEETDEAVCVIDLDTVMPGLALYDFGDLIRGATSPVAEDEIDFSKVEMRLPMFEAIVEGYLETARNFLTPLEIDLLPFSAKLISLETGIRFLTDHLDGDKYFKVHRDNHNLDRCRTQLALVKSIEDQEQKMVNFVKKWHGA
ncbi:MAG: aminoglycoside phosphotransferase family protein [Akkermansiaceae bacterium]